MYNYRISVAIVVKATVPLSARDIVDTIIVSIVFFNKIKIFKHYVKLISEPHSLVFYAPDIKFVVELFAVTLLNSFFRLLQYL